MHRTPLDRLALVIVIIGALNWLLMGLFSIDLIAIVFNSNTNFWAKVLYTIVGLAGLYSISLLFRDTPAREGT